MSGAYGHLTLLKENGFRADPVMVMDSRRIIEEGRRTGFSETLQAVISRD